MARAKTMAEIGREIDAAKTAGLPETETPGVMPPAGVAAKVRTQIEYQTQVNPDQQQQRYYEELRDLAATEAERLAPSDPLAEWLDNWSNYTGYNCWVIRMPDPSTRRPPSGMPYARTNFGPPEQLGALTFDPNPINFVAMLQMINGNSGGVFQMWLIDPANHQIPESVLYNVAIADPPRSQQTQAIAPVPQPLPPPPKESEFERDMKEMQRAMMKSLIDRAMNPPPPALPAGNGLTGEQQAALFLFNQTDFLGSLFGKMKEMSAISTPEAVAATTWKDRAIEAGMGLVESNPAIVERLSGVAERIIARIFPDPQPVAPPPVQYQQYQPAPPPPPQYLPAPPPPATAPAQYGEADPEEIEMTILDEFIELLSGDAAITANDPVFIRLSKAYPAEFKHAAQLIAASPTFAVIQWASSKGPAYKVALKEPRMQARIAELQQVFKAAIARSKQAPAPASPSSPAPAPADLVNDTAAIIGNTPTEEEAETETTL